MVRDLGCDPRSRGFESHLSPKYINNFGELIKMKTIKEGDRLDDKWKGTCYKCGAKVECQTSDLNFISSPTFDEEISNSGEVECPTCQYRSLPVTRQ